MPPVPRCLRPFTLLQRLAGWAVLAALLLGALLPARAAPAEEAYALLGLDICSAAQAGQRGDDGGGPARHAAGDHCSACWLSAAPGLPTAAAAWTPPALDSAEAPALFYSAPRRLYAWASALSRAPPTAG